MNGIAQRQTTRLATFILPALLLAGCFGTGEGPEPIAGTPAPPPPDVPEGFCDPINFEPECPPVQFIPAPDGGFEGGVLTLEAVSSLPPEVAAGNDSVNVGRMIKARAESGLTFGGGTISLAVPFDVVAGSGFTMQVWSPRPVNVLFQPEPQGPGSGIEVTHGGTGWEEMTFPLPALEGIVTGITLIFDNGTLGDYVDDPDNWTFYFDDITLVEDIDGGGGGAQVGLPVTFDDAAIDYDLVDFGDPVSAATTLVADPTDAANTVASTNKPVGSPTWAGTTIGGTNGLASAIPFTATETSMTVRVYSPDAGTPVRLKVEDAADDTISVETETMTTVANAWETLTFDFSVQVADTAPLDLANTYDKVSIFFNFGTDGDTAGDKTYLWDDVAFASAGGGGNAPVVAAPTPTQDEANVISLYSDAYTDIAVTWPTEWSGVGDVSDVTIEGGLTKEHLDTTFVGVEFASLDVSGMTHFHMDIWSPDIETLEVKLVDFGGDGFGGGNDTEGPIMFDGAAGNQPAPAQGQWVSVDISLADMQAAGLGSLTDINQLVFALTPAGTTTLYVDNVYFYNAGNGGGGGDAPVVSAPTPTQDAASVISLYSDAYADVAVTWPTPWSEPDPGTVNDVTIDGGLVKEHLTVNFVGVEFQVDASSMTHLHLDVWTADAESLLVRLVDFGGDGFGGGNPDTSGDVTLDATSTPALTQGSWVSVDISLQDLLDNTPLASIADLNQIVLDPAADGSTVYVDNVYFYSEVPATAPAVSAPTPTQDAANVISLYSDVYTDVAVTWPTPWSEPDPATVTDVTIDGGLVKEHLTVNFVGVEFQVDASSMTHLHLDVWTADAESLLVRLVDFGGDGFGGGNPDTSGDVTLDATSTPALTQGGWVSVDISLQDLLDNTPLASVADLNQIVLDPAADGSTVYVDNVYFYDGNAGGGDGTFVNGDFETGDLAGWTLFQFPDGVGSISADASGQGGRAGTVARLVAAGSAASPNDVVISQEGLGAGTVAAGDAINVSFDLYGSWVQPGAAVFVEVIFLNAAGQDEGGRNFVSDPSLPLPEATYTPTATWTRYSGTVIAGTGFVPNPSGGPWDVSGGVVLSLKTVCGNIDGCSVDASFDNVTFTINGGGG